MWSIQINWNGKWITVETGFKSRNDAEWATAKWKQANNCTGDPFRAVESGNLAMEAMFTAKAACEHSWHHYGTVNGKPDWGCQLCGATKQE